MVTLSVFDIRVSDWAEVALSVIVLALGVAFFTVPVHVARLANLLSRGTPGELIRYNQPDSVARSWRMRLNMMVAGAILMILGIMFLLNALGV